MQFPNNIDKPLTINTKDDVLMHAWMRMRNPQITNEMTDYLINNNGWVHLFKYISHLNFDNNSHSSSSSSRNGDDNLNVKLSNVTFEHKRNVGRLDGIAQSWKATMLFAGRDVQGNEQNLISFFLPLEDIFVEMLVQCFQPCSNACLHHICYILFRLIQKKPKDLFDILASNNNKLMHQLVPNLLYYLHHSAVSSILVDLICIRQPVGFVSRTYAPGDFLCSPKYIVLLDKAFIELDFFQLLLSPLLDNYDTCTDLSKIDSICDSLSLILERLSRSPHHELILEHFAKSIPTVISKIFDVLLTIYDGDNDDNSNINNNDNNASKKKRELIFSNKKRKIVKQACLDVLLSLTNSIFPAKIDGFNSKPYQSFATNIAPIIDNKLHIASTVLYNSIIIYFNKYINAIIHSNKYNGSNSNSNGVQYTGYYVQKPFTYFRLKELEFILIIFTFYNENVKAEDDDDDDEKEVKDSTMISSKLTPSPIEELSLDFVKLLCEWFFDYSHNNIYHCLFLKFLQYIITSNTRNIIDSVLLHTVEGEEEEEANEADFVSRAIEYHSTAGANTSSRGHILECLQLIYRNNAEKFNGNKVFKKLSARIVRQISGIVDEEEV